MNIQEKRNKVLLGKEKFQEAHHNYQKHVDESSVYLMSTGLCVPILHDDGTKGYLDPINRLVVWSDGLMEDAQSWFHLAEWIYNHEKHLRSEK